VTPHAVPPTVSEHDQTTRLRPFRLREEELDYVLPWLVRRSFNHVTPLRDGQEAYPAMLEAIRGARRTVHLETYSLCDDHVGRAFREALIERRQAGVQVRVMYDAVGSFELPDAFVDSLRAASVQVLEFNPVAPWRARWGLNRRNHQKSLVVDDQVGFTGGLNIGTEYAPLEEGGGGWRDQAVRLEGPVVYDLARNFRRTWIRAGGRQFPEARMHRSRPGQEGFRADAAVVSNFGLRSRSRMRQSAFHAISKARDRISVMNAYFLPALRLRRTLRAAAKRGVDVRVIVPAVSDVGAVWWASRRLYTRLLKSGVRILEWPERMMHAKSAVIDGVWTTIGSYNIDSRSMEHNLEVGVIVLDRDVGDEMDRAFEEDASRCREVQLDEWRARPRWHRFVEWFFFQFRYWL
jgi:cardiolipin synthase